MTGGEATVETLIERPKEYQVTLTFHPVNDLSPPIVEVLDVNWRYVPHIGTIVNKSSSDAHTLRNV